MGRSFSVTDSYPHDLCIEDNEVQMVSDADLFAQKLQAAWSTNKNEWSLNKEEGIDFHEILKKDPDPEIIRSELETMLENISSTARIISFETTEDRSLRKMVINVQVQDGDDLVDVPLEY